MHVVAAEAGQAARIHDTGHKIIALHAILVCGAVGEMCECGFAQLVIFQLPVIRQIQSDLKSDRPVVSLALDHGS